MAMLRDIGISVLVVLALPLALFAAVVFRLKFGWWPC